MEAEKTIKDGRGDDTHEVIQCFSYITHAYAKQAVLANE